MKEHAKRLMSKAGLAPDYCGVVGCDNGNAEVVELQPFDPIDHDSTLIQLCPEHQVWADERNEFAELIADELRERRRELGSVHFEKVQDLVVPQGRMAEDVLDGSVEGGSVALEDALEDPR